MSWREIKGQERAISFLKNILVEGKLSGAYLFIGPEGVGKGLTARNFAKILNCEQRGESFDCCDECPSCLKIDNFNHPDVNWIEKLEDAQRISIEQVRNIKREITLKPYEGRTKIYVILEAELLTEEASNCFLKTLEEPPFNSTLILTTSDAGKLLPTIISRCRIVKFSSLALEKVEEILRTQYNLPPVKASFLANLCEGKLGKAIELKDRDILNEKNEIINQFSVPQEKSGEQTFHSPKGTSGTGFLLSATQNKKEVEETLKIMLSWYRDILISKCKISSSLLINLDRHKEIFNLANRVSFEKLSKTIKTIINIYAFIQQNVNPKLALEVMAGELRDV